MHTLAIVTGTSCGFITAHCKTQQETDQDGHHFGDTRAILPTRVFVALAKSQAFSDLDCLVQNEDTSLEIIFNISFSFDML